jgi:hypothetical protein
LMKRHRWHRSWAILTVLILIGGQELQANDNSIPVMAPAAQEAGNEGASLGQVGGNLLKSLMSDVPVPKATAHSFSVLFGRHRAELERLGNVHQDLIWESLAIVIELMPSIKTMDADGSRLRVNRKTYEKVSSLMGRCEGLASPELARDLRKAKNLVESRMTEGDQDSLIIDLND